MSFRIGVRAVVLTRLPILLVGILAVTLVGTLPPPLASAVWRVSQDEITNLLARWDTGYYYAIATTGYQWDPTTFSHQNAAYFPLYPMLMRAGGTLLGGHPLLAGLIVSLVAFAGAIALLHRLALLDMDDEHARSAILLLVTFPYALFFSAVYTESLFLLLTVGAFYGMRRGHFGAAALCGIAAGVVRPNGFWLALPLAMLAFTHHRRRPMAIVAVSSPLIGIAVFSSYLLIRFGDPLVWLRAQAAWGTAILGRWGARDLPRLPGEPSIKATEVVVYLGNILTFIMGVAAIPRVWRRFGAAYGAWLVVNLVPPVASHLFISLGRYTAVLFPLFFSWSLRIPQSRVPAVAAAFAVGQLILAAWFFLWHPVV